MSTLRFTGAVAKYPARFALGAYLGLIAVGALLLSLPMCHADSQRPVRPMEAVFTATSAVCVTGLVVRSTGNDYSRLGQAVVLILIQLGGIGIITVTTLVSFGDRGADGVRQRLAVSEALGSRPGDDARWVVRMVVGSVLLIEGLGWLVLFLRHWTEMPLGDSAWFALFHSVSAYCNAGFGLYDDSLMRYQSDIPVNAIICTLIILGGIGFPVMLDVYRGIRAPDRRWYEDLSLHSQLVLWGTAGLLVFGTVAFLILERNNSLQGMSWPEQLLAAFFHSTTCRTAGFNTVDIAGLTNAMLFVSILLMMIGASPCSTGGGFKVSTMMVLGILARDKLQGYENVRFARRTLSEELIDRATAAVLLFALIAGFALTILLAVEQTGVPHTDSKGLFLDALFEVISALGTVGLSTGLTAQLGDGGRWLLIVLMLIGRLGPISLFVAVSRIRRDQRLAYAKEDVLIG